MGRCLRPARGALRACLLGIGLAAGCADPVQEERLAELGPEDPRVPAGPLHRPGQPCLVCHDAEGTAPRLTAAGTVFRDPAKHEPLGGVQVQLIDAARRSFVAYTNCAGNFAVSPREYEPVLPLWVSLSGHGLRIDMESPMNRNGDCGLCHQREKNPASAGPVFLTEDPGRIAALPSSACGGTRP